jgi:adenylate cyclase
MLLKNLYWKAPAALSSFFREEYRAEVLQKEIKRAGVLATLFGSGFLVSVLLKHQFEVPEELLPQLPVIMVFLAMLGFYEGLAWFIFRYYNGRLRKEISQAGKYCNALVEISIVSLGLFLMSKNQAFPLISLYTPIVWIYFYFIILSTLHLDFMLSVFTGTVASLQYLCLSLVFVTSGENISFPIVLQHPLIFVVKSSILLLTGLAAGYVAHQISQNIQRSIGMMEKQNQLVNLFGQQISKEIVDEMMRQKGTLASTLQRITVMFIDIRGFTSYAETRPPQEVVDYQNAFFGIIIEVVNQHQGVIHQLLGDGCMVTFGAPVALSNAPVNAVKAGFDIIKQIEKKANSGQMPPTRVGIGLHVGEAVTGNIGNDIRQQYSITGNVVITASRIEQLNKEYDSQMLVSADVMQALPPDWVTGESLGMVPLKGRKQKIALYRLA